MYLYGFIKKQDEGLNEEDAAIVLQRFYRKWKVTQQNDEPEIEDEIKKNESRVKLDNWDAPFRIMECHMKDLRSGRIRHEKVDMAAHRREMISAGLQSQDLANQEREKVVAGMWQNVINKAGGADEVSEKGSRKSSVAQERRLSKFGKQMLEDALEKKVQDLRRPSREKPEKMFDIKAALEATPRPPVMRDTSMDSPTGVMDFRRNLKKAAHRPTDSLRKGWSSRDIED